MKYNEAQQDENVVLHGEHVYLRLPMKDDAFSIYEWENDDEVWRYDLQRSHEPDFGTFLETFDVECASPHRNRQQYRFIIEDENHIPIGFIGYFNLTYINHDSNMRQVEIGIGLGDKTRWGQGLGFDAICTLTDYLFTRLYIARVFAQTHPDNQRARHAFAKAGYVEIDRAKDIWIELERWNPTIVEENNEYC